MTDDEKARAFRALHRKGDPFILVNVWDAGGARLAAASGAEALGTTSAGHAYTLGRPDMTVTRDEALAHAAEIVRATPLPVSGDFENGFGDDPKTVAETIRMAAEIGLAGCSIEDTRPPEFYEFDHAVARIEAAVVAARGLGRDFVLCARADGVLTRAYDMDEAMRRIKAFEKAGADCVYIPLPPDLAAIRRVCAETTAPVNILAAGAALEAGFEALKAAGAARISLGSMLARVMQQNLMDACRGLAQGDFAGLKGAANGGEVNRLLAAGAGGEKRPR
jgi:2-methylisocitrate lyase-like PEP mutase family enzyme